MYSAPLKGDYDNLIFRFEEVRRKVIWFSDISAVNLMVGWNLLACSIKRSTSFLSLRRRNEYSVQGVRTHNHNPPIPTRYLREMLGLLLKENSFQFNGDNYLQTHGTAMGTKMAVSFANIFMAEIETKLMQQNDIKPRKWKRSIADVFSLWDSDKKRRGSFC